MCARGSNLRLRGRDRQGSQKSAEHRETGEYITGASNPIDGAKGWLKLVLNGVNDGHWHIASEIPGQCRIRLPREETLC